jgi:hypothetical protein
MQYELKMYDMLATSRIYLPNTLLLSHVLASMSLNHHRNLSLALGQGKERGRNKFDRCQYLVSLITSLFCHSVIYFGVIRNYYILYSTMGLLIHRTLSSAPGLSARSLVSVSCSRWSRTRSCSSEPPGETCRSVPITL